MFSLLFSVSLGIIRHAVPSYRTDAGEWTADPFLRNTVQFAIQLIPFAGIAFLWFTAVLRNRIGEDRDQFFTTVFVGSAILFVACIFVSALLAGGLLEAMTHSRARDISSSDAFFLVRQVAGAAMNIFAIKMAGVFITSTSTIVLRARMLPRWVAFSGFACALILLLVITDWPWIVLLLPLWILIVSTRILIEDIRAAGRSIAK